MDNFPTLTPNPPLPHLNTHTQGLEVRSHYLHFGQRWPVSHIETTEDISQFGLHNASHRSYCGTGAQVTGIQKPDLPMLIEGFKQPTIYHSKEKCTCKN